MTATHRRRRGTGHELREVVIRVATDLLAQLGDADALTMRAVAAAAGVTAPSVYRHFPDKEALLRVVIAERFAEFTEQLESAAVSAASDPVARLEAIARAYVRSGLEQPGHYRVLFSAMNAGPAGLGLEPGAAHPGAASYKVLVDAVSACLSPARRGAAFVLATELWASLHGAIDLRITKPDMPWPEPDALIETALTAVRAASRPGPLPAESP
ncbi:TetR/AcrR family transcriptional regulator [Nonomuraea terrae]|uniref:TetR/AcrR family transcriptional regulator n=1 Tax=Nonomuraea terrae TaxID=2530383 RepID=UPI0037AF8BE6